ncbi:MAG: tRNA (adenosine(37)-N6)-threonylcarbamoyltransferase complex dimerization subunit type 1 TsaB [Gammaproteobacteria bacterium]|nr:tRNA (adenosine(37)-N6)-threonylcarbamoyltransferase complex dimerization subunit type 1 TsaB [Gammaproteobacteria bacterium]
MNKSLAIDTSTTRLTIACENEGNFYEYSMDNCIDHAKNIFSNINDLLFEAQLDIKDLDYISIGIGPGRFSGLRVAASAVQAIAYTHKKNVVTVSSLSNIALVAIKQFSIDRVLVATDAGNNKIFSGSYQIDELETIKANVKDSLIEIKDFVFEETNYYGVGNAWKKYGESLSRENIIFLEGAEDLYPDARTMINYAKIRFEMKEFIDPFNIQPNYLIEQVTN